MLFTSPPTPGSSRPQPQSRARTRTPGSAATKPPAASTLALAFILSASLASAYVPAQPTNDTSYLDRTDASTLMIKYPFPPRAYSGAVSYQLRSDSWTSDTTSGALVHFTEASLKTSPLQNTSVKTPWIAYISCDGNETDASEWDDIFTLARDHGAVSALLYSLTSQACVLNPEYIDNFEKPLDVFATTSQAVAAEFNQQWKYTNESFITYDTVLLNESSADINATLAGSTLNHNTFLAAVLTSRNGTAQAASTHRAQPSGEADATASANKRNNAMIALYVIAGFLAAMVCITVFSVIRRSLQPVSAGNDRGGVGGEDGRAGPAAPVRRVGLAQAIVDTFPLQKFSKPHHRSNSQTRGKQLHSETTLDLELPDMLPPAGFKRVDSSTIASSSMSPMTDSRRTSVELSSFPDDDHCPICLLEFETGDDLRILPCAVQHRFHQACVDPWLLRVSTSCPLCRKDFNPEVDVDSSSEDEGSGPPGAEPATRTPRVTSRYLALISRARRRVRRPSTIGSENTRRPLRPREADQNGPGGY